MSNQEAACYTGPHPCHADSPSRSQTRGGGYSTMPRRHPTTTTPTLLVLTNARGVYSMTPGRRATPDTPSRSQLRGGCIRRRPAATPPPPRRHPSAHKRVGGVFDDAVPPRNPRHCHGRGRRCAVWVAVWLLQLPACWDQLGCKFKNKLSPITVINFVFSQLVLSM
ncbi:hypothetical protein BC826DRAFT_679318 [Russula brevipes]|nr:hypothetical protein BC826DRAFT_679318 [Russula brevipes]